MRLKQFSDIVNINLNLVFLKHLAESINMKINKLFLISALVSTLSLPALAATDTDSKEMPMNQMGQESAPVNGSTKGTIPNGMQMNMGQMDMSNMKMGQGMGQQKDMPMMKMMPQKMAEMKQHRTRVETHLAKIESYLQQLVELQKAK